MIEQIKTTGLKGVINRAVIFSNIIDKDVIDVTTHIPEKYSGFELATNRVMLYAITERLINTGRNLTQQGFLNILDDKLTKITSKEELKQIKSAYKPEYNTGTFKIGEGYRGTANKIMLTSRANFHITYGYDFMLYEYIKMLVENSAIMSKDKTKEEL